MEERAANAKYLILPTAYPFTKLVRMYSIVLSLISKCRKGREILSRLLAEGRIVFRMFNVHMEVGEADDHSPNHNTAIAGKSSIVGEVGEIRPDPPEVVGDDETLDLTDADEAGNYCYGVNTGANGCRWCIIGQCLQSSQELTSQSIRL